MNEAKAIELALAKVIRDGIETGFEVAVRPWQSLRTDPYFVAGNDRHFPLVEIRCAPPAVNDDQSTMVSTATIICMSAASDDNDHSVVSKVYSETKKALDAIFMQFRQGTDGDELTAFKNALTDALETDERTIFHFGGLAYGDPREPYDDGGYNAMVIMFSVHHSRTDF